MNIVAGTVGDPFIPINPFPLFFLLVLISNHWKNMMFASVSSMWIKGEDNVVMMGDDVDVAALT